jgi:hypothetical protein
MVLTRSSAKAVEARSIALQHSIAPQHSSAPQHFEPMYEPQDPCAESSTDYDWYSCSSALQHFEPKYEPQDPCADCGTFWELTGYDENSGVPQYEKRAW